MQISSLFLLLRIFCGINQRGKNRFTYLKAEDSQPLIGLVESVAEMHLLLGFLLTGKEPKNRTIFFTSVGLLKAPLKNEMQKSPGTDSNRLLMFMNEEVLDYKDGEEEIKKTFILRTSSKEI